MLKRNLLQTGDYVEFVPIGYNMTLEYDNRGKLNKILKGFDGKADITNKIMWKFYDRGIVPNTIQTGNGNVKVYGVLTIDKIFNDTGKLPDVIENKIIDSFLNDKTMPEVKFIGLWTENDMIEIRGAAMNRQALDQMGFNTIIGISYSEDMTDETLQSVLAVNGIKQEDSNTEGLLVFMEDKCQYIPYNISQVIVKDVKMTVDKNGYIDADITLSDKSSQKIRYSELYKFQICKKDKLILDEEKHIIKNYAGKNSKGVRDFIICPSCGKKIFVRNSGLTKCSNDSCISNLYPRLTFFINTLNLDPMPYEKYKEHIDNGELSDITDIFELAEYKDKSVRTTMPVVLKAVISLTDLRDREIITAFCNKCDNNLDTILYYFNHTESIERDLQLSRFAKYPTAVNDLINWATPEHILEFKTLANSENIVYMGSLKRFNGPQIFRDKEIAVTGVFTHGILEDITAILESYGAKIVTVLTKNTDCLIIGGKNKNTSGPMVAEARSRGIPVFSEKEFFERYDIDNDLKKYNVKR